MIKDYKTYSHIYVVEPMDVSERNEFIEEQLSKFDYAGDGKNRLEKFEGFNSFNELIINDEFVEIEPTYERFKGEKYFKKVYLAVNRDELKSKIRYDINRIQMCGYRVVDKSDLRSEYFESYEEQISRLYRVIEREKANFKWLIITSIILIIMLLIFK